MPLVNVADPSSLRPSVRLLLAKLHGQEGMLRSSGGGVGRVAAAARDDSWLLVSD
jgi:hypothetical protein